jgi:hypothetical protein
MLVEKNDFDSWMRRIWEKLENMESKITGKEKTRQTINGEKLLDNQDLCFMLNVSKRTLQRLRTSEKLPYHRIDQKLYYLESEVLTFIKEHLKPGGKKGKYQKEEK